MNYIPVYEVEWIANNEVEIKGEKDYREDCVWNVESVVNFAAIAKRAAKLSSPLALLWSVISTEGQFWLESPAPRDHVTANC